MGRVVSKVDAPISEANSTAFWSVGGSEFFKVVDVSYCTLGVSVNSYARTYAQYYARTYARYY